MKPVVESLGATAELEQAVAYYEEREVGLGERLYLAFREARQFIRRNPEWGSPYSYGTRRWRVAGFPYKVIYLDAADEILIVAVAHDARRPGYWQPRLRD